MLIDFMRFWNKKLKIIVENSRMYTKVVYKRKYLCYNYNKEDQDTVNNHDVLRRSVAMENYTVLDIANWFLSKESMDHKKLQKLCYYAQAWSLVIFDGNPLFDGKFEAWVHGPVNRVLWDELKGYSYHDIPPSVLLPIAKDICSERTDFLERVWTTYGNLSGDQLESLTHSEDPWIKARNGISEMQICTNAISLEIMKAYYTSIYSGDGRGE